jgi:lipopolysaccharide biosynthesis glycosyltransferase
MAVIQLGIAFDQNYLVPFYALATSIFTHNTGEHIVVHAIATGITEEEKRSLETFFEQHGAKIHFYQIDEQVVQQFVVTGKWTAAVYYRLYFPFLVPPDVERLLYLDTDIIVVNNLRSLYEADLEGKPVAAVYDNYVKTAPQLGIRNEGAYFNSGVLVIDIGKWKDQKVSEKAFDYLMNFPDRINFVDQDALNAVLIGNWKKLDYRFNLLRSYIPDGMSKKEQRDFLKDKVVIHYTLDRPWKMLCKNPFRHLYHRNLKLSPYKTRRMFDDYSWAKMPYYIRIKLTDLYFNLPWVQALWRGVKSKANGAYEE